MKLSIIEPLGYSIKTLDGTKGTIKDILFDEDRMMLRYLDVDLGGIFSSRRILIPRMFLKDIDWEEKSFEVFLTREDLEKCPELADHQPVSRIYEAELSKHYNLPEFWAGVYPAGGAPAITHASAPIFPSEQAHENVDEDKIDSVLRSFNEIKGYQVIGLNDEEIGTIENMLIDTSNWNIISIIVDVSGWLQTSKEIIVAALWVLEISYTDKTISVAVSKKYLDGAPEFDSGSPANIVREDWYYDFRGRPVRRI